MEFQFLNDSTIWVGVSFILFVILIFKPMTKQLSDGLEKKISTLRNNLDNSIKLKSEAEKLYKEQLSKQQENVNLIKRIEEETKREIKKIKLQIDKEIEINMLRKINNYNQISLHLENKIKEELKNEIINKVIKYTEHRIKNNLSNKYNKKLIENSFKNIPEKLF
ncbi:MAG: hypothetical protein CBC25_06840 [Pelagibacteraceae bacterium TMED65]|nr:hypothetical protein [Rickettsiales bacterium]OUU51130.1 MAG: hypothetical protein CBC25_06840 [Pelagibacteraceae bacterium TMED65]